MSLFGGKSDSFTNEKKEDDAAAMSGAEGEVSDDRDDDESSAKNEKEQTLFEFTNLAESFNKEEAGKSKVPKDDESASNSSVSFGSVRVREYDRVIDSTNIYMGLALGWNYTEQAPAPLAMTPKKKDHTSRYTSQNKPDPGDKMKRTNGSDRYGMLLKYGYGQKELKQATKDAAKFYKQRQREAARSLVVADERNKQTKGGAKPKKRLFRSMFG